MTALDGAQLGAHLNIGPARISGHTRPTWLRVFFEFGALNLFRISDFVLGI
jgi:hypothetical protein